MKVLHLAHSIESGGAAHYTSRLIESLDESFVENHILVGSKRNPSINADLLGSSTHRISSILKSSIYSRLDSSILRLERTQKYMHRSLNLFGAVKLKRIQDYDSDLVHLHWINHGLVSLHTLTLITKPLIWSVLDMWPFSGAEHYISSENEFRLGKNYSSSSRVSANIGPDFCKIIYKRKQILFEKKISMIYPSVWLQNESNKSSLVRNCESYLIPPPIDSRRFLDFSLFYSNIGIRASEQKEFFIGFGGGLNARKGFHLVKKTFLELRSHLNIHLIHFGTDSPDDDLLRVEGYNFIGKISPDPQILSSLFGRLDLLLFPSSSEGFGLLAQEAQMCGCPVAVISGSGSEDIVENRKTGIVANTESAFITEVVKFLMSGSQVRRAYRIRARRRAIQLWDYPLVATKVAKVYSEATIK